MIGKLNEISDKSCSLLETDFSLLEEITFSSCDKFNKFESFSKTYKSASLSKSNSKPSIIKSKKAFDVSRFIKFFKLYFNVADLIKNTNVQVGKLTSGLETMRTDILRGNDYSVETEEYFKEIVGMMNKTNEQNNQIAIELKSFVENINEIGAAFSDVAESADGLTRMAQELND